MLSTASGSAAFPLIALGRPDDLIEFLAAGPSAILIGTADFYDNAFLLRDVTPAV